MKFIGMAAPAAAAVAAGVKAEEVAPVAPVVPATLIVEPSIEYDSDNWIGWECTCSADYEDAGGALFRSMHTGK